MASSGSFTTTACEGRSLTFSWSIQSQSTANNTTTISWNLKGAGSYTGYVICGGFNVVINGSTVYSQSTDYRIQVWQGTTIASGTHTISHNSDGSKSFSASAQAGIYTYAVNCSGSGTWALTQIARSSAITSAANVTLGNKCSVTWTPANSSFQYDIRFSLGSWAISTGKMKPNTTSAYTYNYLTIPASYELLSQIPKSPTGTMTATLTTYDSSGNQIGSTSSKQFTVTVPSNIMPTIGSISLTPQTYSCLVQNKNTVTISVSGCQAGTGSSIKSYSFSGPGITYGMVTTSSSSITTSTISNSGTLVYTITVTDNRGRSVSTQRSIACYAYNAPSFTSFDAYRVSSSTSTTASDSGEYVRCVYGAAFSSVNGTNDVTVKIKYKTGTGNWAYLDDIATDSKNTSGSKIFGTFPIDKTYVFCAEIADNYGGNAPSSDKTVFSAKRILNIRPKGDGIAFGKMAGQDKLLDSMWAISTDEPEQTMKNLSYRGANIISSTTDDTTTNWGNQGNLATTFYNTTGQITDQPSQYGLLLNLTNGPGGAEVHQMWATQASGNLLHRGGNHQGWSGSWKTILDSANYTNYSSQKPTTLYSGSGTVGTITLLSSAANFTYLEIFYTDNHTRQPNSVKVYSPNGKYVSLSCIEPSTNNSDPRLYIRTSGWTISDTSMTPGRTDLSGANRGVFGTIYPHANGTNIDVNVTADNYIKIFRVLGYA